MKLLSQMLIKKSYSKLLLNNGVNLNEALLIKFKLYYISNLKQ